MAKRGNSKEQRRRKRAAAADDAPAPLGSSGGERGNKEIPSDAEPKKQTAQGANAKKRKRARTRAAGGDNEEQRRSPNPSPNPLNGLVIAVSTLDERGKMHQSPSDSYKSVAALCASAGASITNQVHRRCHAVVCTETAVRRATQRVRKAVKKKVPLVKYAWVEECVERGERVEMEPYLLDGVATAQISLTKATSGENSASSEVLAISQSEGIEDDANALTGWSDPVDLDCCCVCHENNDLDCPWCADCNITVARKKGLLVEETTTT